MILLSYAAKSLDSLGSSAWGRGAGASASPKVGKAEVGKAWNLPVTSKEPLIRSGARVLHNARQTLYPQLDCNLIIVIMLS